MIVNSPNSPASYDYWFLILYFMLTLIFLYQSWANLIKKELSKFSIDALAMFLVTSFGGTKSRQRAKTLSRDPKRILLFGIFALLGVIAGIYEIIRWFQTFTLP